MESQDIHLNILLDIQKQLGTLGAENSRQSAVLTSIEEQVKKTNGRVGSLEKKDETRTAKENQELGERRIKSALWGVVGGFVSLIITSIVKKFLNL